MENVLWALTVVIGIAAFQLWRVLRDVRSELKGIREPLEDIARSVSDPVGRPDGTTLADQIYSIRCILGGIQADMPEKPFKPFQPQGRPDPDRFRAPNEEGGESGSFRVMDRRSFAADGSPNAPSNEKTDAK